MLTDTRPANIKFAHDQVDDLLEYANSFNRGYCKHWKAVGILVLVAEMPNELCGTQLREYVESCLIMEGFDPAGCASIADWIDTRFEPLRTLNG